MGEEGRSFPDRVWTEEKAIRAKYDLLAAVILILLAALPVATKLALKRRRQHPHSSTNLPRIDRRKPDLQGLFC